MQGRFTHEALDRRQAETLFREHLNTLQKRLTDSYVALLDEVCPCGSGALVLSDLFGSLIPALLQ